MTTQQESVVAEFNVPLDFTYDYRVGPYIEKYIKGLGEKKILGVKCSGCGRVAVPPRKVCGACNLSMDNIVELGPEGTVENYTVAHVRLEKGLPEELESPQALALIKLDGATGLLAAEVKGADPGAISKGTRVRAVFADPPGDSLFDLKYFEPVA